jgi:Bacterial archaeo-eukaryotic release factor family 10
LITNSDVARLRTQRARNTPVISIYLNVPVDIAEHRGLLTRARELIKGAADNWQREQPAVSETEISSIIDAVDAGSLDWLGHTVAIFASAELGLFEAMPMAGSADDLAVLATRPYLRPLLAVMQRNPAHQVAVIDAKHAWVLAISDDEIATLAERTPMALPSPTFAGWYGLQAYRIQHKMMKLARQHYRDTIGLLSRTGDSSSRPLVLGGHEMQINQFLTLLPPAVRQRVAGSFNVDLQTATPARVRELAAPVIARWTESAEAQLVDEMLSEPPATTVTTSLADCVKAVRSRAVSQLVLADGQMVPGCACDDCGAVGVGDAGCDCPDQACQPVPDVLDELSSQALAAGGEVAAVRDAPFTAAARLRFQFATPG